MGLSTQKETCCGKNTCPVMFFGFPVRGLLPILMIFADMTRIAVLPSLPFTPHKQELRPNLGVQSAPKVRRPTLQKVGQAAMEENNVVR
jgi:hypothetical protein